MEKEIQIQVTDNEDIIISYPNTQVANIIDINVIEKLENFQKKLGF